MSNLYTLTAKIHELLAKVCTKNNIEQIKIESDYGWFSQTSQSGKTTYFSQNSELNCALNQIWDSSPDYHCPAIQAPQLRQILVGLKEVLGMTESDNLLICPHCGYQAEWHEFDGNPYGNYDKCPKCDKVIEDRDYMEYVKDKSQAEALDDKWLRPVDENGKYTGQSLFDRDPEKVLQEVVELLENLLKQ